MDQIKGWLETRKSLVVFGAILIFLWIFPWGKIISFDSNLYLTFLLDMTKLGVALGMFIIPGALIFIILQRGDTTISQWSILPVGFALSVSIIAVIGIVGRLLGFSFALVKILFALIGLGGIFLLSIMKSSFAIPKGYFFKLFQNVFENIPLLLALILAISMTFNGYQLFIDDTTYAAYVTNWLNSTHLGFNNIVHQANVVELSRFWLALYPMGQALLSDLSGVPVILLFSNYLELFLVPLAVVTAYWFARVLGLSRKAAGVSVFIQILFYTLMIDESWPVGFWFFQNMAEDKVAAAFLLTPVFFTFVLELLRYPTGKNIAFVLLCGIALMLTHPIILFLSCMIAGGISLISWFLKKTGWRAILKLVVIFVIVMLPYLAIRLYDQNSQAIPFNAESVSVSFQADRYVNLVNDVFYGLNPEVLMLFNIPPESNFYSVFQLVRLVPVVLALSVLVLALFKIREGTIYWYITTCVLLVVFATIPYTGWILGYFISARMISRVSWFSPLGLAGTLLVMYLFKWIRANKFYEKFVRSPEPTGKQIHPVAKGTLTGLMFAGVMFISVVTPRSQIYFEVLGRNKQLAQVGAYIDQNTDGATTVIALDYVDTQLLPSVAAHVSLISFREEKDSNGHNYFFSIDEIHRRILASNAIRSLSSLSVSNESRCLSLENFDVKFILANYDDAVLFITEAGKCNSKINNVFQTDDLILLEIE